MRKYSDRTITQIRTGAKAFRTGVHSTEWPTSSRIARTNACPKRSVASAQATIRTLHALWQCMASVWQLPPTRNTNPTGVKAFGTGVKTSRSVHRYTQAADLPPIEVPMDHCSVGASSYDTGGICVVVAENSSNIHGITVKNNTTTMIQPHCLLPLAPAPNPAACDASTLLSC